LKLRLNDALGAVISGWIHDGARTGRHATTIGLKNALAFNTTGAAQKAFKPAVR
jgi:hypothetical protein